MKFIGAQVAVATLIFVISAQAASRPRPRPILFTRTRASRDSHPAVGGGGGWQSVPEQKVPFVPITYPKYGEVWLAATHHNVTWDTMEVPKNQTFSKTAIFLAKEGEVVENEPLASNFSLHEGRVTVQTPTEVSGDDFQVILYTKHGSIEDRGSYSENYAILNVE